MSPASPIGPYGSGSGAYKIDAEMFREQERELEADAEQYAALHPEPDRTERRSVFRGALERLLAAISGRR